MRVSEVWRYPVKSIGGETLEAAEFRAGGVAGDREWAVRDDQRDEITWAGALAELMRVRARTTGDGGFELELPDGARIGSAEPDIDRRLTEVVGAKVSIVEYRPDEPAAAVHLVTTASLRTLAEALPEAKIDVTRFRPNLVLDTDETGYPEHDRLGRRLQVGPVRLRLTGHCLRCVMITKATPSVPHDRSVLRWVARQMDNTLGVYAEVETPGRITVGDEARWLD